MRIQLFVEGQYLTLKLGEKDIFKLTKTIYYDEFRLSITVHDGITSKEMEFFKKFKCVTITDNVIEFIIDVHDLLEIIPYTK